MYSLMYGKPCKSLNLVVVVVIFVQALRSVWQCGISIYNQIKNDLFESMETSTLLA